MIETRDTDLEEFAGRLDGLFGTAPAGLESAKMESAVLARVQRRRRLRVGAVSLSTLVGFAIAIHGLSQAALPKMGADRFLEAAGNSFSHTLYLSLGSGPLVAAVTCGALTVLGLAFARVLEEV